MNARPFTPAEIVAIKRREAAAKAADWSSLSDAPSVRAADQYLFRYCNSVERPKVVLDLLPILFGAAGGPELWRWLAEKWPLFDAIPHARFHEAFRRYRGVWAPTCMAPCARSEYDKLPGEFEAYRGQDGDKPVGLSWTLDRSVAARFAEGHRRVRNAEPAVLKARVKKSSVAFTVVDRMEAEVVVFAAPLRQQA